MVLGSFVAGIIAEGGGAMPAPYPKIFFTFVTMAFGAALLVSRWGLHWTPQHDLPQWTRRHRLIFFVLGLFGGMFAAN